MSDIIVLILFYNNYMLIFKRGILYSISQYMETTYHMSSSIELRIDLYGTNSEMCNEIMCIDGNSECRSATYIYNIMII